MKTVAEKIKNAISRKGYSTVKECAQTLGLPYELLRKVVGEDHIPKDNQLLVYANKLGMDPMDLLFTAYHQKAPREFKEYFEKNVIREARAPYNKVPVLSWNQIDEYGAKSGGSEDYITTNLYGDYLFCLRVKDNSMSPLFFADELLIIDPDTQAQPGDYVIAKKGREDKPTLKQLLKFGEVLVLHPLNPKYDDQEMTKDSRVFGKVVRKQMDF